MLFVQHVIAKMYCVVCLCWGVVHDPISLLTTAAKSDHYQWGFTSLINETVGGLLLASVVAAHRQAL